MIRKGHIPAGAKFDPEQDEFFERASIQALRNMPSSEWPSLQGIWGGIDDCHPSTRQRILGQALRLCSERRQPPPEILVDRIEAELNITAAPRARAKDAALMAEAARYLVRNPRTSHRKIAAALGRDSQADTIYRLLKRSEFWRECAEQSARYDDERSQDVLTRYVNRFGPTFDYGTEETGFAALSSLVPFMIDALENLSPLTNNAVRAIVANQSEIRSEEALKRRLLPVAQ